MGFMRGSLLFIICALFFIVLLVANLLLVLSLSLDYDSVKPKLTEAIVEIVQQEADLFEVVNEKIPEMELYCQNYSDFVFLEKEFTFTVPCDVVSQGPSAIVNSSLDSFVYDIYYKDYDCAFWDCFKESEVPYFLVSEKARDYWLSKFYIAAIAALILLVIMFLLIESKPNFLIVAGGVIIVATLPLRKVDWLLSLFGDTAKDLFMVFFSESYSVFLVMIIVGIALVVVGILFKFIFYEYSKKKFSTKEVKDIVKKEVAKSKKEIVDKPVKKVGKPEFPDKNSFEKFSKKQKSKKK